LTGDFGPKFEGRREEHGFWSFFVRFSSIPPPWIATTTTRLFSTASLSVYFKHFENVTLLLISSSCPLTYLTVTPAEIKARKASSSSLTSSSTTNQAAAATSQISGPKEIDFVMGSGDMELDWMANGLVPSGAYFLNVPAVVSHFSSSSIQDPSSKAVEKITSLSTTRTAHYFQ